MSLLRRIRPLDTVALVIAAGALAASVVVWDFGAVTLGLTLTEQDGRVVVHDVTPSGNAHTAGIGPGLTVLNMTRVDGSEVQRGEPIGEVVGDDTAYYEGSPVWEIYLPEVNGELRVAGSDYRLPNQAIDTRLVESLIVGHVSLEEGWIDAWSPLDRGQLETELYESIWIAVVGVFVAAGVWLLLRYAPSTGVGRSLAVVVSAAAAVPFLLAPLVAVGTAPGIAAGFLVPIGLALLVGLALARAGGPDANTPAAIGASVIAAVLAVVLVVRYLTAPALYDNNVAGIYLAVAAVTAIPAMSALVRHKGTRARVEVLSVAAVPVFATTTMIATNPQPVFPLFLLALALGWQLLPRGIGRAMGDEWGRIRPSRVAEVTAGSGWAIPRDTLLFALIAVISFAGLSQPTNLWVVIGLGLGALTVWAIRRDLLGGEWRDMAVPLGAAIVAPFSTLAFLSWDYGGATGWAAIPGALSGLGVAHGLAARHTDPRWRDRLFLGSVGLVVLAALLGGLDLAAAAVVAGLVPLVPGVPAAFADVPNDNRPPTWRLEALAVALTPGVAISVLAPAIGLPLLATWLVAIVVWRRFTLAPLIGLAQRTQLQRDVAVAAAETERARLAADLHDDALQQLTMLVRRLDEKGHTAEAEEAREIATKLRWVVGDLRLPILDDLGAGAALEWLVERVEPLAGGPVKLERSDETRPPANVELAVFRVAQEALTNAIKHGRPPIAVRYEVRPDGRLTLAIEDAGEGILTQAAEEAPKAGHFGLLNMQQRAEHIGALLDIRRWPSGGTRVALEWRPQGS